LRLAFLVPLGFAVGAVLCKLSLSYAPASIAVDRAQPLVVVTYWQQFGLFMWVALFIAIAIASVGYVAMLLRPPLVTGAIAAGSGWFPSTRLRAGWLTMTSSALTMTIVYSVLACVAALAFPVVFSSDAYAYAGYGWLALHGISPYAHAAVTIRDPLMSAVLWQWGNPPPVCVYGPAFIWFAQAIVAVFQGFGPAAPLWALRIAACLALVLCAPLAYYAFANFPRRTRLAAAAGIALNPVAIWASAEGHNDVFVIAIVLAGFALIARSQPLAGAFLLVLSALVKLPGLLAAAAAIVAHAHDRSRFSRVLLGSAAGCILAGFLAWPALSQLSLNPIARGHYFPQFSLQYALSSAFGDLAAIAITAALTFACVAGGCMLLWRRNISGAPLLALALWIAIPDPYPWYAFWILPVAFIAWETPAAWAIVALTLCTVVRYLPDATIDPSRNLSLAVVCVMLGIPAAAFILRTMRQAIRYPRHP